MSSTDSHTFDPGAYDQHLCLTPGPLFWLASAFILRPLVVLIASLTQRTDRFGLLNLLYPDHSWAFLHTGAALPTLAVVIALTQRKPTASPALRWIWRHGFILLLTSLALNVVLLITPWLTHHAPFTLPIMMQLAGCGLAVYVLLRSSRVRASFREFPLPPAQNT